MGGEAGAEGSVLCGIVDVMGLLGVRILRGFVDLASRLRRLGRRVGEPYDCDGRSAEDARLAPTSSSSESNMACTGASGESDMSWSSMLRVVGQLYRRYSEVLRVLAIRMWGCMPRGKVCSTHEIDDGANDEAP